MGNQLRILHKIKEFVNKDTYHTYDQLKQKISLINLVSKDNNQRLGLKITLSSVRFEASNWKKSKVKGIIQINGKIKHSQLHLSQQQSKTVQENIILSYEDINILYELMKNLQQFKQTPNGISQEIHEQQILQQTATPQYTPHNVAEQCCICLQKTPSMVLPCSHAFCDNCTIKYIIDAQQKKCPQCRHQIKGSRQSVQKQIYTLINQDQQVHEQITHDIIQVLKNLNPQVVQNAQQLFKNK